MQKSRQGLKTTALGLCLSLGLTQVVLPLSVIARGKAEVAANSSSNTVLAISAPIGTITSSGTVTINGRPASGAQAFWNGELLEAPANAPAVVKLVSLGELNLTPGALVRVAATGQTLVASVYEGMAEINVAPQAMAYLEAAGEAWIVKGGTSLKLAVTADAPVLRTTRGAAHRLGGWSLNLPSFNGSAVLNTDALKENAEAERTERAALLRSIKLVTQRTVSESKQGLRLVANARAAMIGMIESDGAIKLNGRPMRRQELLWDNEIIQAEAEARVGLVNYGSVRLAVGTRAKLSTAAVAGSDRRVLAAHLLNGELTMRLNANAGAYIETCGKAFSAEPGAHFRLSEEQGNLTLEIKAGKVREIANLMMELSTDLLNDAASKNSERQFTVRPADKAGYLRHLNPAESQELRFVVTNRTGKVAIGIPVIFTLSETSGVPVGTLGAGDQIGRTYETRTDEHGIALVPFTAGRAKASASIMAMVAGTTEGNSSTVVVSDDKGFWTKRHSIPVFAVLGGAVAAGIIVGLTRDEPLPIQGRGGATIVP